MKLYNYWRSSSSWRVRIALSWKGIGYEYVPVNLAPGKDEQSEDWFLAINPMRQVPVLEIDPGAAKAPRRITQSLAILEYLEETFPEPPLLPSDPWQRARVRQLCEVVNAGIQPLQNVGVQRYLKKVLGADEMAFTRHFVECGLLALERMAAETGGIFLVGDAVSLADVYLVPQLHAARRWRLDLGPLPTLLRVETACEALAAFQKAHPERQPDAVAAALQP